MIGCEDVCVIPKICSDWFWRWSKVFVRIHFMDVKFVWDVWHFISSWKDGMDVKFVFTMPTGNLECIHLWNVCMKTGRRYLDWMPNSGSFSRRIVMEKALIFYPIYWRWKLKMWCEVESSCYQGSGYNLQLQIEWSSATPDIECRGRSDSI